MIREILEKYVNSPRIAGAEWELMLKGNIPVTPSLWKQFEVDREIYHLTDYDGMVNLKKIEGQKKMVAGFTEGGRAVAFGGGKLTDGTVLAKLKGKVSFSSPHDMGTFLDRNGNRWIPWDEVLGMDNEYVWINFTKKITDKIKKRYKIKDNMEDYLKMYSLTGKEKHDFIKWYFDEAKKLLTKKFIKGLLKQLEITMSHWRPGDEALIHSFKIIDVKTVMNYNELDGFELNQLKMLEDWLKGDNIKVSGRITRDEIVKLRI